MAFALINREEKTLFSIVSIFCEVISQGIFTYINMEKRIPKVLILGHSFVQRFQRDLKTGFDSRTDRNFKLKDTAKVYFHGVGGRTVSKLRSLDLHVVRNLCPDIVILEIGTNDLSFTKPETVGSAIEDLVNLLLNDFSVGAIGVCHVIPRGISYSQASEFFHNLKVLNQYVSVVLEPYPKVFCWAHREFNSPHKNLYLSDSIHLNSAGQYFLYRSYRGAILKAISMI